MIKTNQIRGMFTTKLGSDPEFFFLRKGNVIGAERMLPEDGLLLNSGEYGKVIVDGVQAEINNIPDTCRQRLASRLSYTFKQIKNLIDNHEKAKELSISIDPLMPIAKAELGDLSDKAKFFGCTPSKNIYDEKNVMPIKDSSKYYFRSIGGHIHIGFSNPTEAHKNAKKIVSMLDIIVGNTCVLVDRHEGNVERRKNYGRAGEYRLPNHGIEYRTPSSFWLRDYRLMSFVHGLSRLAVEIILCSGVKLLDQKPNSFDTFEVTLDDFADRIFKAVDMKKVRKAINENDFDLAMDNFMKIVPILEEIVPYKNSNGDNIWYYALDKNIIPQFLKFVKNGVDKYIGKDVFENWLVWYNNHSGYGWENFMRHLDEFEIKEVKEVTKK